MKKESHSLWSNLSYLLKGIWDSDKKLLAFMVLEAACMAATPWAVMYLQKVSVDLAAQHSSVWEAVRMLGGLTAAAALSQALGSMASRGKNVRQDRLRSFYRTKLFGKTLDCDYAHVESAEWQDKYSEAREMSVDWGPWSGTTLLSEGAVKVCSVAVSFVIYGKIIGALSLWLLGMILFLSALNFIALRAAQKYEMSRIGERSGLQRRREYVRSCSSDTRYGKDIRLYEMSGWIRGCFQHYNDAHFRLRQAVQRRYFKAAFTESVTMLVRDGISYLYFLYLAVSGSITAGDFVLACSAAAAFSSLVTQTSDSVGQMMQAVPPLNRMRDYLDAEDEAGPEPAAVPSGKSWTLAESSGRAEPVAVPPGKKGASADPSRGAEASAVPSGAEEPISVVFEDVSFSYEGRYPVLTHFNLRIGAGEKIALVGTNGAGKTTIIKLLCGFYRPDSGRILLNGRDVRSFRKEQLYRLAAPVFQEAMILPFTVAQNVTLREKDFDREKVRECLIRVGLWEKISSLPEGMDSRMMNLEENEGTNLSGGQQQKLLMARALYKGSMLLFFDEPTAALDPVAESETYEMFHGLSGGKTAVFISHRLASTRFCDRVVFLKNGAVEAEGSHEELLERCPEYEKMYRMQSRYYRKKAAAAPGEGPDWEEDFA